eukprot:TRINITY_DN16652_c0_g1_i1.p1 TRINITY_DN16652_c0_g1~~TRINITY_DN16652_c0_g1_i1.p1  ORF type:complete len:375 (-),score=76.62 TRINITY_DN16652_c0_g1_i1:120-1244(-)
MKDEFGRLGICNEELHLREYQDIKNIEGLYKFFRSSAKRKECIGIKSEQDKLYDDILDKHEKTLQLLQDSIDIMDYRRSKVYKDDPSMQLTEEITAESPKETLIEPMQQEEKKRKPKILSLKELVASKKRNIRIVAANLSRRFTNDISFISPLSQIKNPKSTVISTSRSFTEFRQDRAKIEHSKIDIMPIYKPIIKHYKMIGRNRKLMPGPLNCLIKSFNNRNDKYQVNDVLQSLKSSARNMTRQKAKTPRQFYLNGIKIDAKYQVELRENKKVKNIRGMIKKLDRYGDESVSELKGIKDSYIKLESDYLFLQAKLKGSNNNEEFYNKEISRSATEFRRNKIGFVYGMNARGRYIFTGMKDKVRELDNKLHNQD